MTESTRTYQCLGCSRHAVRIVPRVAQRDVTDAVCAHCGLRLQVSGLVELEEPARAKMSKRGRDLARTPLNTECSDCDHALRDHDFSHPSVRCQSEGCGCWAFREDDEAAV